MSDDYQTAADLGEHGKSEIAWKIIGRLLIENPNDVRALVTGSYLMRNMGGLPQAYHFAKAATQIIPNDAAAWTNLGHAASSMWLIEDAERAYKKGLQCSRTQFDQTVLWTNLGALYLDSGQFDKALHYVKKVLAVDPENHNAKTNLGFCQLALRDWKGWKGYHGTIGTDWRPKVRYRDEPEWDGTPGKRVVLYADQGLGDEISFASMVPDAAAVCQKLILDCDGRLENLFRRSFPGVTVYGTRTKEEKWAKEDRRIDASLPLGQVGEFFRLSDDSFPGTPYLKPCPLRVKQWRALFHVEPTVGIAWTGGVPKSNSRNRRVTLEDLLPVLKLPARFVSLQYRDAAKEIDQFKSEHRDIDLCQYRWGTLTDDYDDTAALVASVDYVLCMQTAVAHTAGALGVPVTVLLPTATTWRYGLQHDSVPWYKSLKIIRQKKTGSWSDEIARAASELQAYLGRLSSRARETACDDGVRYDGDQLRSDCLADHQSDGRYPLARLRVRGQDESRQELKGRT